MDKRNKLTLQMFSFFLIIFIIFGTIIINEKKTTIFLPKIENFINEYIEKNYNYIELKKSKITIKNNIYIMKVMNKENNNHYFYIKYFNKQITDTYEEDYFKGQTLINHLNKQIEKTIKQKTNNKYTVIINNTYDNYSSKIKERLLKEKNIETLPIYTIETEITTIWNDEIITNEITNIMTSLNNKNITPKNYTITITDKENITKAVKITNLSIKNIENNNLSMIINDIINNKKTNILSENKIAYKYLN